MYRYLVFTYLIYIIMSVLMGASINNQDILKVDGINR